MSPLSVAWRHRATTAVPATTHTHIHTRAHAQRGKHWGSNERRVEPLHPWMRGTAAPSESSPRGTWMITMINFALLQKTVIDSAGKPAVCWTPSFLQQKLAGIHFHCRRANLKGLSFSELKQFVWTGVNWMQPIHPNPGTVLSDWCGWQRWWEAAAALWDWVQCIYWFIYLIIFFPNPNSDAEWQPWRWAC